MIKLERLLPMNNWRITVEPPGLPWAGTTMVLTDEEMRELWKAYNEVKKEESSIDR